MPMASTSPASAGELASAPPMTSRTRFQISVASCSTQPACGVICSCSRWSMWTIEPSWSNRMQRELVVPWSIAAMYLAMGPFYFCGAGVPGSSMSVLPFSTTSGSGGVPRAIRTSRISLS